MHGYAGLCKYRYGYVRLMDSTHGYVRPYMVMLAMVRLCKAR